MTMNQRKERIGIWIFLCGMILFGAGCAGVVLVGGTAATAVYLNGELSYAVSAPMEEVWKASEAVMADKEMKATEKSIDNPDRNRVIKGKTRDNKDFQISLEGKDKDVTVIKVRVGYFGDQDKSLEIIEAIEKKIKEG
jgi:uncharacterized protein YabE (DUF348 family)